MIFCFLFLGFSHLYQLDSIKKLPSNVSSPFFVQHLYRNNSYLFNEVHYTSSLYDDFDFVLIDNRKNGADINNTYINNTNRLIHFQGDKAAFEFIPFILREAGRNPKIPIPHYSIEDSFSNLRKDDAFCKTVFYLDHTDSISTVLANTISQIQFVFRFDPHVSVEVFDCQKHLNDCLGNDVLSVPIIRTYFPNQTNIDFDGERSFENILYHINGMCHTDRTGSGKCTKNCGINHEMDLIVNKFVHTANKKKFTKNLKLPEDSAIYVEVFKELSKANMRDLSAISKQHRNSAEKIKDSRIKSIQIERANIIDQIYEALTGSNEDL